MSDKFEVTDDMVLRAISSACSPDSTYINDEIHKVHVQHVRNGGTGHSPRTGLVLRRLRKLEARGLLTSSKSTDGYYGYHWTITSAGWAVIGRAAK